MITFGYNAVVLPHFEVKKSGEMNNAKPATYCKYRFFGFSVIIPYGQQECSCRTWRWDAPFFFMPRCTHLS